MRRRPPRHVQGAAPRSRHAHPPSALTPGVHAGNAAPDDYDSADAAECVLDAPCPACGGVPTAPPRGAQPGADAAPCATCRGTGRTVGYRYADPELEHLRAHDVIAYLRRIAP
jgi:hypothetical protein